MDEIIISELEVFANHGVFESERKQGQIFYINANLKLSTREAGCSDDLNKTVNYGEVCDDIKEMMTSNTYSLLETVAEHIAENLLIKYSLLSEVTVEILKPHAPISIPFKNVSVRITRKWNEIIIATGSNLGDSKNLIEKAMNHLAGDAKIQILRKSGYYESEPYGGVEQPKFTNGAFYGLTLYTPYELLALLKSEEQTAQRMETVHWGPRTLDLDIIYYGDIILQTEELTVPHKDMQERDFVLVPIAAIQPYKKHPVYGTTAEEMLKVLKKRYINP